MIGKHDVVLDWSAEVKGCNPEELYDTSVHELHTPMFYGRELRIDCLTKFHTRFSRTHDELTRAGGEIPEHDRIACLKTLAVLTRRLSDEIARRVVESQT